MFYFDNKLLNLNLNVYIIIYQKAYFTFLKVILYKIFIKLF